MRKRRWMMPAKCAAKCAAICAVLTLAAAAARPGAAQTPEPATVKVSTLGGATDAGLYLADEYGLFRKAGIAVDMDRFGTTSEQVAAIATGQVDVAGIAVTAGLFASVRRGIGVRIVGDKQSIRRGFSSTQLVLRTADFLSTERDTIASLKGKTFAGPTRASFGAFLVSEFLKAKGMTFSDIKYVEMPFPSIVTALSNGAIDGASMIEPFLSLALRSGAVRTLGDPSVLVPEGASVVPLVYSEAFIGRRALAQDFMTAYMGGVRIYNDAFVKGRDKDKVIGIIARRAKVEPAMVRDGYMAALDPDQRVNKTFLAAAQNFFAEQNMLQNKADIDALVDPSFAEAAVAALGAYH
jgi:NitT/TauT family transport system substrate-binding protein